MITKEEALNNGLISEYSILNNIKCNCGEDIVFSDSFRTLHCANKDCKCNIESRINNFAKKVNIQINENLMQMLINDFNVITPYQLLVLPDIYDKDKRKFANIQNIENTINGIKDIISDKYYLYNIIEWCGYTEISSIAKDVSFGFNSVDELYTELEQGQVYYLAERLGLKNGSCLAIALELYNKLLEIKDELIFVESIVTLKQFSNRLFVAFNDHVSPFINKNELIDYLNNKYIKYTFVIVNTINEQTDILIRHIPDSTKCKIATYINDKNIAFEMNNNNIALSDIGKVIDGQLKPSYHRIFIVELDKLLSRLDELNEDTQNE